MTRPWWDRLLRFIGKKLLDYTDPDRVWREKLSEAELHEAEKTRNE